MIENEWKYVLSVSDWKRYQMELRSVLLGQSFEITQGYLDDHSRIRKMVPRDYGATQWFFTHKRSIAGKVVEIETPITERDFEMLWTLVRPGLDAIYKTRVKVHARGATLAHQPNRAHDLWEVDFIRDAEKGNLLMIMAEIELPEDNTDGPSFIPPFINDHVIWRARQDDLRFTNRQLANIEETRRLMETLT